MPQKLTDSACINPRSANLYLCSAIKNLSTFLEEIYNPETTPDCRLLDDAIMNIVYTKTLLNKDISRKEGEIND